MGRSAGRRRRSPCLAAALAAVFSLIACGEDEAEPPISLGFPDPAFQEDVVVTLDEGLSRPEVLSVGALVSELDGVESVHSQEDPPMVFVDVTADADESAIADRIAEIDGVMAVGNEVPRPS